MGPRGPRADPGSRYSRDPWVYLRIPGVLGIPGYRKVSVGRNTVTETQTLKWACGRRKTGRTPKENDQKPRQPTETQGPCPDLRGFCIKALNVHEPTPAVGDHPEILPAS